jgi:hypothetical protein
MIVNISHPTILLGRFPRGRKNYYVNFPARTAVDVREVQESATEIAFRLSEIGRPALTLLALPDSADPRAVWWPITDESGTPVPAADWVAAMERDGCDLLKESGLAALCRTGEWPDPGVTPEQMRRVKMDFRDEITALVSRAANDLMLCGGLVWRRRTDPMYCVEMPSDDAREARTRGFGGMVIRPLHETGERRTCLEMMYIREMPEEQAIEWNTVEDCCWARATYFRADEGDDAMAFWLQRRPPGGPIDGVADIEVIKPECVRSVPSIIHVKATIRTYLGCVHEFVPMLRDVVHHKAMRMLDANEAAWEVFKAHDDVLELLGSVETVMSMVDRDSGLVLDGKDDLVSARSELNYALHRYHQDRATGRLPGRLDPADEAAIEELAFTA